MDFPQGTKALSWQDNNFSSFSTDNKAAEFYGGCLEVVLLILGTSNDCKKCLKFINLGNIDFVVLQYLQWSQLNMSYATV